MKKYSMKTIHVVAAIIADNGRILATQRGHGDWKGYWEFPGGKIESGEAPEDALLREIKEELDVVIVVGEYFVTVDYDYPAFHLHMDCFMAKIAEGRPVLNEHADARWIMPGEWDQMQWLPADLKVLEALNERIPVHPPPARQSVLIRNG